MNSSIKMNIPCEFINITPFNPLISKVQIKVCYVGDEPNRNKSIITKDAAKQIANSLPGSPIVGHYNKEEEDFEEHNKVLAIKDGKITFEDDTFPYGFVDLNAKVWFQKYDDNGVIHEYMVTEGYIWTGQFPESKRIVDKGNNQSMQLDENIIDAYWTKDQNGAPQFFIINEAIISKLCILGDKYEPCFEGSNITKTEFSFEDSFKNRMFSMIEEITNYLKKGGEFQVEDTTKVIEPVEESTDFAENKEGKCPECGELITECKCKDKKKDEYKEEEKCPKCGKPLSECTCEEDKKDFAKEEEEKCPDCGKPIGECECKKDKKEQYILDEIPEYIDLKNNFETLQANYSALENSVAEKDTELTSLREFKKQVEKKEKEALIESFYMLSDDDKKDVVEKIDEYSLDEIEAKLSIICVRNKVSFDLNKEKEEEPMVYNLNANTDNDGAPAWIKAARAVANSKNQ